MKTISATILAVVALAAAPAGRAQDRAPDWLKRPSERDLMGVWPTAAMKAGTGGKATIACIVTVQGALRDCRVTSESPAGAGFGGAGLTLSTQLQMRPALKGGVPVESFINVPIVWPDMREGSTSRLLNPDFFDTINTRVISNVRWSQAPTVAEVLAAYPAKAREAKAGGLATLDCALTKTGGLHDCRVLQEAPTGLGFGAAARGLSAKFTGPTVDAAGTSLAGAHVQLPFAFSAEALAAATPVIGQPQWAGLPRAADLIAVYPQEATKAGVLKARVVLGCTVAAAGVLADCQVVSEDPAGYGLGKATLGLAPTFRLSVWTAEGLPTVGGSVHVPIRFDISQVAPPAAPKP